MSLFCLWEDPLGTTSSTPRVGLTVTQTGPRIIGHISADAFADILVNDKKNSVCLSMINFGGAVDDNATSILWRGDWHSVATITVYDIHGNRGDFTASYTHDKDAVMLRNRN